MKTGKWVIFIVAVIAAAVWIFPEFLAQYYLIRSRQHLVAAVDGQDIIACEKKVVLNENNMKKTYQAISIAEYIQKRYPAETDALLILGRGYCLTKNFDMAIHAYTKYLETNPKDLLAWAEFGFAKQTSGDLHGARSAWRISGISSDDFLAAAFEELQQSDLESANDWLTRLNIYAPGNPEVWYGFGKLSELRGDYDAALESYQAGIQLGSSGCANAVIELYAQDSDREKLINFLEQTLSRFPESDNRINWWQKWGDELRKQGKFEEAVRVYENGIKEYPKNIYLLSGLAYSQYGRLGMFEKAAEIIEAAIEANPNDGLGYFVYGDLLFNEGRYQEAIHLLQAAIERNATVPVWYWKLVAAYKFSGDQESALEIARNMVDSFPQYSPGYLELAELYLITGNPIEASEIVDDVLIKITNFDVPSLFTIAEIFERSNSGRQALNVYLKILHLDPENIQAKKKINEIQQSLP